MSWLCKKCKKMGGHRAFISKNSHNVCKSKNIAIRPLKWTFLCQILFKWTYEVNLVNWWGSLKNKFVFSNHSFTRLAGAIWQYLMSSGQNFFNFPHWFFISFLGKVEIINKYYYSLKSRWIVAEYFYRAVKWWGKYSATIHWDWEEYLF